MLELYRQVLQQSEIEARESSEERELQLSGLVVKEGGKLRVYNPIYAAVFDELWIDGELAKLRPYAESFRAWVISGKTDKSRLLRGDALKEAKQWAKEKNPSAEDQDFISESRTQEREEEIAVKESQTEKEANKILRRRIFIGTTIGSVILAVAVGVASYYAGEVKKQNEMLTAVRSLSQLAGTLRKNGEVKVSDEALRKAGLSTLIDNEDVKKAWLFAATAEAHEAVAEKAQIKSKEQDEAKALSLKSLDFLKNSNAQIDQRIFNEVSAFVYFMAAQSNNDKEKYYKIAYKNFKDSRRDAPSEFLTDKDILSIHFGLIDSPKDNKDFKMQVKESLKKSLPYLRDTRDINDLLVKQKWIDADGKTSQQIEKKVGSPTFCLALRAIDLLWLDKSKGRLGFSIQKQIYLEMGNKLDTYKKFDSWEKLPNTEEENNFKDFATRVGWTDHKWTSRGDNSYDYNSGQSAEQFPRGFFPIISALQDKNEGILSSNGGMFEKTGWLLRDDSSEEEDYSGSARKRAALYLNRSISLAAKCGL